MRSLNDNRVLLPHPECCGQLMQYAEVFGVRVYMCRYRSHHPVFYRNLVTGEQVSDDDPFFRWQAPGE